MECSGRVRMCPWNVSSKKRLCSVSVPRGWLFLEGVVTLWYLPRFVGLDFTPDLPCRETKPYSHFVHTRLEMQTDMISYDFTFDENNCFY